MGGMRHITQPLARHTQREGLALLEAIGFQDWARAHDRIGQDLITTGIHLIARHTLFNRFRPGRCHHRGAGHKTRPACDQLANR